ncbi:MAG: PQQ-binding-like beta-propeller repeat protein [Planctomycetes bacterium]|nr:PQQ-binding-like beta-propeller repeat protein [Planctomycetota bacterium]
MALQGNLADFRLGDLLQTLAQSQTWGILRLQTPLGKRELSISQRGVALLNVGAAARPRIEERLLHQGFLSSAAFEKIRTRENARRPLEEVLAEVPGLPQSAVTAAYQAEATEHVHQLMAWSEGTFELVPAEPPSEVTGSSPFDVAAFVMEAARRQDEREAYGPSFPHPEERFVRSQPGGNLPQVPAAADFIRALDGRLSLRSVADRTLGDLFYSAKLALELEGQGYLRRYTWPEYVALCESFLSEQSVDAARRCLRFLVEKLEPPSPEELDRIAQLQVVAEDPQGAAQTRAALSAGYLSLGDAERALDEVRAAVALAPRDLELRRLLLHRTEELLPDDPKSQYEAARDLLFACAEAGAAAGIDQLEPKIVPGVPPDPAEQAAVGRALGHLGRRTVAAQLLCRAADGWSRSRKHRGDALNAYREAQKLAPEYTPAGAGFDRMSGERSQRRKRWSLALGSALLICGVAAIPYYRYESARADMRLVARVEALLAKGQMQAAAAALEEIESKLTDSAALDRAQQARQTIARSVDDRRRAEESEADEWIRGQFASAAEAYDARNYATAVELYDSILRRRSDDARAQLVRQRLVAIEKRLRQENRRAAELTRTLQSPHRATSLNAPAALTELGHLASSQRQDALRALGHRVAQPTFAAALTDLERRSLREAVEQLQATLELGLKAVDLYRGQIQSQEELAELERTLLEGRDAEARGDARAAAAAFASLKERYRGTALKPYLDDRSRYWQGAVSTLDQIDKASTSGDGATTRRLLDSLRARYPEVKLAGDVELPLEIVTTPPGAKLTVDGQFLGVAPTTIRRKPTQPFMLRAELDGFESVERKITPAGASSTLDLVLPRRPIWTVNLAGPPSAPGAMDRDRWFVSDRRGSVHAIQISTGKVLWTRSFSTLGGFVGAPALAGPVLFCATAEGELFALDCESGAEKWQISLGVEPAFSPVVAGNRVFLASKREGIVHTSAQAPGPVASLDLGSRPTTAIAVDLPQLAVGLQDGAVAAWNAEGQLLFRSLEGEAPCAVGPGSAGWIVFAGTRVSLLSRSHGGVLHQRELPQASLGVPSRGSSGNWTALLGSELHVIRGEDLGTDSTVRIADSSAEQALMGVRGLAVAGSGALTFWPADQSPGWLRPGKGRALLQPIGEDRLGALFEDGEIYLLGLAPR